MVAVDEPRVDAAEPEPVPLRRNRDFNLLWTGQAVSALGSEISEISYPLLILVATGSAAKAGLVGAALLVAYAAALLPAGVVADRYRRKRILVVSSLVQGGAVATVVPAVLGGHVLIAHLMAVGAVQGVASAFYLGANRGAIRRLVPPSQLPQALSRTQARDQAASLVGPPIGGTLFGLARFVPFLCDAVSFLAIAIAATFVRGPVDAPTAPSAAHGVNGRPAPGAVRRHRRRRAVAGPGGGYRGAGQRSITKGMRFVLGNPYLRTVAIWATAVNVTGIGMLLMTVVLARYRGASPAMVGVVVATSSIGGLAGALLATRLIALFPGRRMVLIASWVMVLCPVGMALAPEPWLIAVPGALAMFSVMPVNVILLSRATELTPHHMQAQAGNAMVLLGSGLKWVAPPIFGLLADWLGPVTATLIGAVLYLATAIWLQGKAVLHQLNHPVPAD